MTTNQYLQQLLETCAQFSPTEEEKVLAQNDLRQFIYQKLTSKKFRKTKMDPDCEVRTKKAIDLRLQKNQPITLVYPQGGYKLWRFPSSPTADWAEFFNIAYVLQYVAPVAAMYQPGVHIVYYMHTLLMELHDNLTTAEIQAYVDSFEQLLEEFRKFLPKNIKISILRDADIYSRDEYFAALENGKTEAEKTYQTLDQNKKNDLARMAKLNIKWQGKEDWTKLSESEKNQKIYLAALYEMAATSQLPRVFEKVKSEDNVLVFTKATKDFIGIGSTKSSVAKHWVGYGVLQKKANSFLPVILTPSQFQLFIKQKHKKDKTNLISLPNFAEIDIFEILVMVG